MDEIQQFSLELANNLIKCSAEEYFKMFHDNFYNNENIDFMEYFLELVPKRKEFCVEQTKLQEYKVLNNINTSKDVRVCLNQYDLEENVDYLVGNVPQQSETSRGTKYKKEYYLTPGAFKLCLIRAKNSKIYAKYYMRYEEMYYYYKYYQNEYQNKLLSMKDDKIDNLTKKVEEQSQKIDKQSKDIEELLNYGKKTTEKLDDVQEDLNTMSEEFDNVNEQFDNLHEKVDDIKDAFEDTANRSVPNFKNNKKKGVFLLLQYKANINKYKFIRGMKQYTDKMLNSDYEDEYNLIEYDYNVNPIALFNKFKEIVKDELKEAKDAIKNNNKLKGNKIKLKKEAEKIKFANTNLELVNGFTQEDLSKKLKEIANLKFKEYEDATDDIP